MVTVLLTTSVANNAIPEPTEAIPLLTPAEPAAETPTAEMVSLTPEKSVTTETMSMMTDALAAEEIAETESNKETKIAMMVLPIPIPSLTDADLTADATSVVMVLSILMKSVMPVSPDPPLAHQDAPALSVVMVSDKLTKVRNVTLELTTHTLPSLVAHQFAPLTPADKLFPAGTLI